MNNLYLAFSTAIVVLFAVVFYKTGDSVAEITSRMGNGSSLFDNVDFNPVSKPGDSTQIGIEKIPEIDAVNLPNNPNGLLPIQTPTETVTITSDPIVELIPGETMY
jgi:hypothetical protein